MKTKHNKKRNTAFLYESLIKEVTKSVIDGDKQKELRAVKILKRHFSKDSILKKELELYRSLYESTDLERSFCEKVIKEAKLQRRLIGGENIFQNQTELINDINKELSPRVYNNFIPNYKTLASIAQIFSDRMNPKSAVILENEIIDYMSEGNNKEDRELKPIDNIVLNSFVTKFNEKYSDTLINEQKQLLNHYIVSFADNGLALKMFLNEEIGRIKNELEKSLKLNTVSKDNEMTDKIHKIISEVDSYANKRIDETMIRQLLNIQNLVQEIRE